MKFPRLPNREKIINELTRRYEEVLRKADKGIRDDEEAQQFMSLLAHYVYYVKKTTLTERAIKRLFEQQELLAGDKALIKEADKIIAKMRTDRSKLVRYAKKHNIDLAAYKFGEGSGQITGDAEPSFYLQILDQFLKLPSDQQSVGAVPREMGNLLSVTSSMQRLSGEGSAFKKMRAEYRRVQDEYAKKLKMQGVYIDYLRVEDYRALESIWREVYQEEGFNGQVLFHLQYGHLFEKNHSFSGRQQGEADQFVTTHVTHLQRVHNYLIDCIEDVSSWEKFFRWTVEHFGPTFVSLILLVFLWWLLNRMGINIGFDLLQSRTRL